MLLPESPQEWLPEGHLAHFISEAIDGLDFGRFHSRCHSEREAVLKEDRRV